MQLLDLNMNTLLIIIGIIFFYSVIELRECVVNFDSKKIFNQSRIKVKPNISFLKNHF